MKQSRTPPTRYLFAHNTKRERAEKNTRGCNARRGFTLTEILLVMAVMAILSAVLLGALSLGRNSAQRAQCDVRLKAIVLALDAFHQEYGNYPEQLDELYHKKYLSEPDMLRCPCDPRKDGSLGDFYILRARRDSGELPILVCPLCTSRGEVGIQGFKGRYTKQFATRPAQIIAASSATIISPGKDPIAARAGMALRGGDIIRTAGGGAAKIHFADGSSSELSGNAEITLLQSFIAGHAQAPLYTLIRQQAGNVLYRVHRGSKFDVSTPTATAGALGTTFQIMEDSEGKWWIKVTESKVLISDLQSREVVAAAPLATSLGVGFLHVPIIVTQNWTYLGQSATITITDIFGNLKTIKKIIGT